MHILQCIVVSKSSVECISKVGMECKLPKKRTGRPPILNRREKDRSLRKFTFMREENPNLKVGAIAMKCELHHVSTRRLSRLLNQSGYKYVWPSSLRHEENAKGVANHARSIFHACDSHSYLSDSSEVTNK